MKKIINIISFAIAQLNKIGKDRYMHLSIGAILSSILALFTPIWIAMIICTIIFIAKEFYDKKIGGKFDYIDIIYDYIGAIAVWIPLFLHN